MTFDGKTSHQAHTKASPKGLRDFIAEAIAIGVIAISAAQVWTLIEIRKTIETHNKSVDRSVSLSHANALVTERALAHLEERRASKEAAEFRVPPKEEQREAPADR